MFYLRGIFFKPFLFNKKEFLCIFYLKEDFVNPFNLIIFLIYFIQK